MSGRGRGRYPKDFSDHQGVVGGLGGRMVRVGCVHKM